MKNKNKKRKKEREKEKKHCYYVIFILVSKKPIQQKQYKHNTPNNGIQFVDYNAYVQLITSDFLFLFFSSFVCLTYRLINTIP